MSNGFPAAALKKCVLIAVSVFVILALGAIAFADDGGSDGLGSLIAPLGDASAVSTDSPVPDLFTGTMKYAIPINLLPGRKGMAPTVTLNYRSSNGNGWLGVGWELEMGAIERSTKKGVTYDDTKDQFILRGPGGATELVNVAGTNQYVPKIESGSFLRIIKNGSTWEVTDKKGTRFLYGQTTASQLYNLNNSSQIFKWCLNQVIDTNGNFISLTYTKDYNGSSQQIYLSEIDYTGNGTSLAPTNAVKFILESRNDTPTLYSSNLAVQTAKRLKTIEVWASSALARKYVLAYDAHTGDGYSPLTRRSVLGSVTEYGSDGVSAKPAITLHYANDYTVANGIASGGLNGYLPDVGWSLPASQTQASKYCIPGNFGNGFDVLCSTGNNADGWDIKPIFHYPVDIRKAYTNWPNGRPPALSMSLGQQCIAGDFKGSGTYGLACNLANNGNWTIAYTDGTSGTSETWGGGPSPGLPVSNCFAGDFNSDGKTDISCYVSNAWHMALSTGSGWTSGWGGGPTVAMPSLYCLTGDFDGDGKTDLACNTGNSSSWSVYLSTGSGWNSATSPWSGTLTVPAISSTSPLGGYCRSGDFNGDGKTDIACFVGSSWKVLLSTGSGWDNTSFAAGGPAPSTPVYNQCVTGDFNGDGKTDIACFISGSWSLGLSTGSSWYTPSSWGSGPSASTVGQQCFAGDFSIDGKTDIICYSSSTWTEGIATAPPTDLLTSTANGLGSNIAISYNPAYPIWSRLIYPVQAVSDITVSDGNGISGTTSIIYAGSYYYAPEKDFRGFNYVKMTGPTGPGGKQTITETYFHQGNGTTDPSVPVGYMKGKPYLTRISDQQGKVYSETEITYRDLPNPNPNPYYYNPTQRVDTYVCDGNAYGYGCKDVARRSYTDYTHDNYGNITREDRYGDVSTPANTLLNMTVARSFSPNTTSWIVGLPASESIYQGIGTSDSGTNLKIRETSYYYDDLSDCNAVATGNLTPTVGNLTRSVRWLNGGSDSESRIANYEYGNPKCSRDPNGNVTTIGYDATYKTFPTITTNAKSQTTTTSYYGVGTLADKGRFGQPKSVTDANNAVTTAEYDVFGRKTKDTQPDSFWTGTVYNSFGSVGSQSIYTTNQLGIWSAAYFDGLGRTFKVRRSGPDSKVIVSETHYDQRGMVSSVSQPYFEGVDTPLYRTYSRDPLGRITKTDNPDGTYTLACYNDLVTVYIDENGHRKRETKDPLGRLATVDEYTGVYTTCDTSQGTPYATTSYTYDVLGNLTGVTADVSKPGDSPNLKYTTITYDSLGRKKTMTDPDMGYWEYGYYADGTLYSVKDANHQANGQLITYDLDVLNRPTVKHYPADSGMVNVTFGYDGEGTTSTNPKGRLTSMTDASGSSVFHYDKAGRISRTDKTVDGITYTIGKTYDGLGRISSITYPNNDTVSYHYDTGGNLFDVTGYAEFDEYNAIGQPGKLYYGNGIVTSYWYYPKNNRLLATKTDGFQATLAYKTYSYDNKGNIASVNDLAPAPAHNLTYGTVTYTPDPARAHAVLNTSAGRNYLYDSNGNMTSDGTRSIAYTPDNLPKTITMGGVTTTFVYDGNGKRTKKTSSSAATVYIGNLYECTGGYCDKHIYAGNSRIAIETASQTFYHHPDHLGSTSIVTNNEAVQQESIAYYPFGETRNDTSSVILNYKYTGQELDYEVNLYNYGARLYDPEIGRFISPDSIIPDYTNPQYLNRYAYVLNNPLKYIDSTGHFAQVRVDGNRVNITLPIIYSGNAATPSNISALNNRIQRTWSGTFGGYNVTTIVVDGAKFIENSAKNYGVAGAMSNYIELKQGTNTSFVSEGISGTWYQPGQGKPEWEAAHEAGHLMGLPDQYVATYDSNGNRTGTQARPGFENNIMGEYGQTNVTGQDINNVIPWTSSVTDFFSNLFSPAEPTGNVSTGSNSGSEGDISAGTNAGSMENTGESGSSSGDSIWSLIFGD